MNNLKRILSLALAGVMTLGMMTVGAGAAFTDNDQIVNSRAAAVMSSLGIINGREDGSFDPKASVNRAEMAKMIAIAHNGGDIDFVTGSKTFADVTADQWFYKYVSYCANLGFINGREDGLFHPTDTVTGYEAAKMMLGALGYVSPTDEDIFGFTGNNWYMGVTSYANKLGLYDEIKAVLAGNFNRDDAAQLIYNGLFAPTTTVSPSGVQNGSVVYSFNFNNYSLLSSKWNAYTTEGILTGFNYDAEKGEWCYDVTVGNGVYRLYGDDSNIDLFEHNVQAVYTYDKKDRQYNLIGMTTLDSYVLSSGTIGEIDIVTDNKKIDGYEFDRGYNVYNLGSDTAIVGGLDVTLNKWDTYELIDNDNDKKIDLIVIRPTTVAQISDIIKDKDGNVVGYKVGASKYYIDAEKVTDINAWTKDEFEKDDFVLISAAAWNRSGTTIVYGLEKLELGEEIIVSTKSTDADDIDTYTINGKQVNTYNNVRLNVGGKYELVEVNGYIVGAKKIEDGVNASTELTTSDVIYIAEFESQTDPVSGTFSNKVYTQKVGAYFVDGSYKIIEIGTYDLVDGKGEIDVAANVNLSTTSDAGLYSFTEKNGVYTITLLKSTAGKYSATTGKYDGAKNMLGFHTLPNTIDTINKGGDAGKYTFANDGVFFVKHNDKAGKPTYSVLTGKQINGWKVNVSIENTALYAKVDNKTGTQTVGYGFFQLTDGQKNLVAIPGTTIDTNTYGYVVSDVVSVYNPETKTAENQITIWNGSENVTYVLGKNQNATKGTVVLFDAEDGEISKINVATKDKDTDAFYVSAFTSTKVWLTNDTNADKSYTLGDDTVIIYINSEKVAGATAGNIAKGVKEKDKNGKETDNTLYNVIVHADASNNIKTIIIDLAGAIGGKTNK